MQLDAIDKVLLPALLFIVMLGMGFELKIGDFKRVLTTPLQALIGSVGHFVFMPLAAFIVVKLLALPPELALGVILVGACPSGTTSNLLNYLAKADVALAVVITSVSTLLCAFLTPLVVTFLGSQIEGASAIGMEIKFVEMVKLVAVIIVVPVSIGMFVRAKASNFADKVAKPFKIFSILFLISIIIYVVYKNRAEFLDMVLLVGGAVILHNLLGLAMGYLVPKVLRIPENQSRTISIEVGVQNTTLALTIAANFFTPAVALPAAVFSLWMYISGLALAGFWSRRPPKDGSAIATAA